MITITGVTFFLVLGFFFLKRGIFMHPVGSFAVVHRLSSCGTQAPEYMGLVALWHVES